MTTVNTVTGPISADKLGRTLIHEHCGKGNAKSIGGKIMELKDFTENEQKQISRGLSTAEISDTEAADKLLALLPEGWIKKIPFFVRKHATTKTIERIAKQYPELYAAARKEGDIPEKEKEELRKIITDIFGEKMKKHQIK